MVAEDQTLRVGRPDRPGYWWAFISPQGGPCVGWVILELAGDYPFLQIGTWHGLTVKPTDVTCWGYHVAEPDFVP